MSCQELIRRMGKNVNDGMADRDKLQGVGRRNTHGWETLVRRPSDVSSTYESLLNCCHPTQSPDAPFVVGTIGSQSVTAPLSSFRKTADAGVRLTVGFVALLWVVEAVDTVVSHRLDRFGVRPHELGGLRGIAFAPFLHAGWSHLIGNTIPFAVLTLIVAGRSVQRYLSVFVVVALVSGLGMWLFGGSNELHLGASGVIFGLLTYVMTSGFFARRAVPIIVGVVVAVLYGGTLRGVFPTQTGVSWQGHLFGALGGVLAAYLFDHTPEPTASQL